MTEEITESKQELRTKNTAFIKLCVSLAVLGLALILRVFFPEQTGDFLQKYIAGGFDYTVVLGDVGDSLRSFVLGVPHPDEIEVAGDESDEPEQGPPPEEGETPVNGTGGLDLPIFIADARYFVSELGEDDTFPLPFGMQKPERVDYTMYDLPFETVMPAEGRFSSAFGYRVHPVFGEWRFHFGIDIANASGTPIVAFADGVVTAAGTSTGYGNYVILKHEGEFYSLYAHCRTVNVKMGQTVALGQQIAQMGSTGISTGPHLHFELRYGNAFLDPANYLDV